MFCHPFLVAVSPDCSRGCLGIRFCLHLDTFIGLRFLRNRANSAHLTCSQSSHPIRTCTLIHWLLSPLTGSTSGGFLSHRFPVRKACTLATQGTSPPRPMLPPFSRELTSWSHPETDAPRFQPTGCVTYQQFYSAVFLPGMQ